MADIFKQGSIDYCKGKKLLDNPYLLNSEDFFLWEKGWIKEMNLRLPTNLACPGMYKGEQKYKNKK